jgi:hypothetical protein
MPPYSSIANPSPPNRWDVLIPPICHSAPDSRQPSNEPSQDSSPCSLFYITPPQFSLYLQV